MRAVCVVFHASDRLLPSVISVLGGNRRPAWLDTKLPESFSFDAGGIRARRLLAGVASPAIVGLDESATALYIHRNAANRIRIRFKASVPATVVEESRLLDS